jgi:hypothetical protein
VAEKVRLDPIQQAMKDCNTGNTHKTMKAVYKRHWAALTDDREQREYWDAQWKPVVAKMTRKFRDEFRSPVWKQLFIEWLGKGYSVDYLTVTTKAYLHYRVMWDGMVFERHFAPTCMEDVHIEAWDLCAVLAEWKRREDSRG